MCEQLSNFNHMSLFSDKYFYDAYVELWKRSASIVYFWVSYKVHSMLDEFEAI